MRFGVEIQAQNSGIQSQKSDSNHYFGVDSAIIWEWIQLQMKSSLLLLQKEWISTPLHD